MSLKRSVSFITPTVEREEPPKFMLDQNIYEESELMKQQMSILDRHPMTFASIIPNEKKHPFVPPKPQLLRSYKFPEPIAIDEKSVVSPPTAFESKWTNVFTTPDEPSTELDTNQGYSDALCRWIPCSWEGVLKLPIGTWIQYTSNVYPEYKLRKKIVCVLGPSPEMLYENIFVWTPMSKDRKHYRETTTELEAKNCRAGYHLPSLDAPPDQKLFECTNCLCKGWKLGRGSEAVKRIFYVSPWTLNSRKIKV